MKNRMLSPIRNKGKFWCIHGWRAIEKVGLHWDLHIGTKILCRCNWCGKEKYVLNTYIKEVPDELIDPFLFYP